MATLVIDNFGGRLTRFFDGDINNGRAKFGTTFGNDPFSNPGNLTWFETGTQIDSAGSVITDLIMCGKERVESGISYVYAVGHTGRVYKIQNNDPTTFNPNYDNPVLLTTITAGTPTFTRGGYIDFYGATEKMYIGHDKGVTSLTFDGATESAISGTWTQTVPRPIRQFVGKLYIGNGTNLAEIDSTGTVTTSTKLSPSFPDNTQVRDLDVSNDGNYLEAVVTRLALPSMLATTQDTTFLSNSESYIFKWNGTDTGYTAFDTFPSFSLNSNAAFGRFQYTFGYDLAGSAVFNPTDKILSPVLSQAPTPNAVGSNGNIIGWATSEFYNGFNRMVNYIYGSLDNEIGVGWWRQFAQSATGTETDVIRVPFQMLVSNFQIGSSTNGYGGGVFGSGKAYFSTLEVSGTPTTKYKFYKWFPVSTTTGTSIGGVYETQNQLFSKKQKINAVRIYGKPWVASNSFKIDLIGSSGNPITNGSLTFTAQNTSPSAPMYIGNDFAWWSPQITNIYSLGLRITNLGSTNHTIMKVEIDYETGGQ